VHGQLFSLSGVEWSERLDRAVHCELLRALRDEDGFSGALSLVRRDAGDILLLVFWETESQASRPPVPSLAAFLEDVAATGATCGPLELWEVGARA
jgi:hypothetical protein